MPSPKDSNGPADLEISTVKSGQRKSSSSDSGFGSPGQVIEPRPTFDFNAKRKDVVEENEDSVAELRPIMNPNFKQKVVPKTETRKVPVAAPRCLPPIKSDFKDEQKVLPEAVTSARASRPTFDINSNNKKKEVLPEPNNNITVKESPYLFLPSSRSGHKFATEKEEIKAKYAIVKANSGEFVIGRKKYSNVKADDIIRMRDLGEGAFGKVYQVQYCNQIMAEKVMRRTESKDQSKKVLMDLFVIRKSSECDHIVQFYGYIISPDYVKIYMELMGSCTEKLLIERNYAGFPNDIIGKVTLSVVKALVFLRYELEIMHRDLKPSNILLGCDGRVKLCDFGISGQLINSNAGSMTGGCISYLAPERLRSEPYTARADVWSLGITLVELAKGVSPYSRLLNMRLMQFELMPLLEKTPPPLLNPNDGFSLELCDFISRCLNRDANQRPGFKELLSTQFLMEAEESKIDVKHWLENQNEYTPKPNKKY